MRIVEPGRMPFGARSVVRWRVRRIPRLHSDIIRGAVAGGYCGERRMSMRNAHDPPPRAMAVNYRDEYQPSTHPSPTSSLSEDLPHPYVRTFAFLALIATIRALAALGRAAPKRQRRHA